MKIESIDGVYNITLDEDEDLNIRVVDAIGEVHIRNANDGLIVRDYYSLIKEIEGEGLIRKIQIVPATPIVDLNDNSRDEINYHIEIDKPLSLRKVFKKL